MKILLAVDGSPGSAAAIQSVLDRPWPVSSVFRVLSCVTDLVPLIQSLPPEPDVQDVQLANNEQLDEAKQRIVAAAEALRQRDLLVETAIRHGDPDVTIVKEAGDWGAEWILIGANDEKSALERWLLGSTMQSVVRNAHCSVEVIRPRAADNAQEKLARAESVLATNGATSEAVVATPA